MIHCDSKTQNQTIIGEASDVLAELSHITSSIEEALARQIGVEGAEELVNTAIQAGREYNRLFVFGQLR